MTKPASHVLFLNPGQRQLMVLERDQFNSNHKPSAQLLSGISWLSWEDTPCARIPNKVGHQKVGFALRQCLPPHVFVFFATEVQGKF